MSLSNVISTTLQYAIVLHPNSETSYLIMNVVGVTLSIWFVIFGCKHHQA